MRGLQRLPVLPKPMLMCPRGGGWRFRGDGASLSTSVEAKRNVSLAPPQPCSEAPSRSRVSKLIVRPDHSNLKGATPTANLAVDRPDGSAEAGAPRGVGEPASASAQRRSARVAVGTRRSTVGAGHLLSCRSLVPGQSIWRLGVRGVRVRVGGGRRGRPPSLLGWSRCRKRPLFAAMPVVTLFSDAVAAGNRSTVRRESSIGPLFGSLVLAPGKTLLRFRARCFRLERPEHGPRVAGLEAWGRASAASGAFLA
jgi:hypothetical protein